MDAPLHPDTVARLRVPSLALDGCVYAYLWRDLSAAADISDEQLTTWFPATPLCGMSWALSGQVRELAPDGTPGDWLPAGLVGGPRSGPKRFRSTRGGRAFMVAIRPEAFQAMTGVDLSALKGRMLGLSEVVDDPDWRAFDRAMQAARDEHEAQRLFESFLLPRWREASRRMAEEPNAAAVAPRGYSGWMQHLAMRAVAAGHGRSVRQAERRIKQWSGQSLRALRLVSRAEAAFKSVRRQEECAETILWSALAHDNGYADQAHLCRETRRLSGFSPEELRRLVSESESFWAYRVWV